jgi:hypothetical protein
MRRSKMRKEQQQIEMRCDSAGSTELHGEAYGPKSFSCICPDITSIGAENIWKANRPSGSDG